MEISPDGTATLRVRMIDSVGYMVDGAVGAEEDGVPRMVKTPWFDHEIPMTEAAELGTKKVIREHCSIGLVVTTDGTVTDIPRADYVAAERRAITDMQATGKPYIVIVNSREPRAAAANEVAAYLQSEFGVTAAIADCQALDNSDISALLQDLLYAFPMQELQICLPRWMDALEPDHPVKAKLYDAILSTVSGITSLGQAEDALSALRQVDEVTDMSIGNVDLASGSVRCVLRFPEQMYYQVLSSKTGIPIQNDVQLLTLLTELAKVKEEYDKVADAIASARATGYGIVMPSADEMTLQTPEVVRKGGAYGVKLKAGAPSIHMIRVDIDTEISPMVGDEKQSQDLISYLSCEDSEKLWQSNIFGKSVYELIQDGLTTKLLRTPEDVRNKFRGSLSKIINDGATSLICLIL